MSSLITEQSIGFWQTRFISRNLGDFAIGQGQYEKKTNAKLQLISPYS